MTNQEFYEKIDKYHKLPQTVIDRKLQLSWENTSQIMIGHLQPASQ